MTTDPQDCELLDLLKHDQYLLERTGSDRVKISVIVCRERRIDPKISDNFSIVDKTVAYSISTKSAGAAL
jgi:hypothetical protein